MLFVCFVGFCFLFFVLVFQDRVSLYSPGCLGTHSVDQAGLELRNLPTSASQVLGLKACATPACPAQTFNFSPVVLGFEPRIPHKPCILGMHTAMERPSPTYLTESFMNY